jgi:cytochrome b561
MPRRSRVDGGAVQLTGHDMAAGEAQGYLPAARIFHWVTAALVLTMLPIGIAMATFDLGAAVEDPLYHIHRSIGALVLVITAARLIYRLGHPVPPLPAEMPPLHQSAAHVTHWALYALLIVQPLIGWIATSAYRAPTLFFWLFELPPIWPENRAFSDAMFVVHRSIGILIATLVLVHIAAALRHHFILGDGVLKRMVSG